MIKTIVFDAYGTLISTGTGSLDATQKILKQRNRTDISAQHFYSTWKKYHKKHMEELNEFINEEEIFHMDLQLLYQEYSIEGNPREDVKIMLNTLGKRTVFPEVLKTISALSSFYTLCIGSTTDTSPLLQDIKNNSINIDNIYTSEKLRVYKPRCEFYQFILDDLNISPQEMLFVGDSLIDDIWGPQQLNITTCWINRTNRNLRSSIQPDYTITHLDDLISMLSSFDTAK